MTNEFVRDAAMTAVIFGFFASGWFGWAQEDPPPTWRRWLIAGSVLALPTAIAGGILAWRSWSDGSAFDARTSPIFGIIVGVEVVLAAGGAIVLTKRKHRDLIPAWVAVVVGVHFLPMAPLLGYPMFYLVGVAVTVAGLVSIPLARSWTMPVSAVVGLTVGTVLLAAALHSLVAAIA